MCSEGKQDRFVNPYTDFGYQERLKNYRDWYSVMKTAEDKGLAKGMEEGLAKGMEEGLAKGMEEGEKIATYKLAKELKNKGMDMDFIKQVTNLSDDELSLI